MVQAEASEYRKRTSRSMPIHWSATDIPDRSQALHVMMESGANMVLHTINNGVELAS